MSKRRGIGSPSEGRKRRTRRSLVDVVRTRADETPERQVFVFLGDGEREEDRRTWGELDTGARAVAVRLGELGLAGERVLLLFPPGLDFVTAFLGCLYAGVVAVPAYPPQARRGHGRLRSMVADARPAAALTSGQILGRRGTVAEPLPDLAALPWLAVDGDADPAVADLWTPPRLSPDDLAFLQYTSGSTAEPKGVMVTHGNLVHNEEMIRRAFRMDEGSVVVGWLPVYHDMGLIGNVLQPLVSGGRCVMMAPVAFLRRPRRWLEAIGRYGGTTSGGPNFAYDLCCDKIPEDEREGLDLSSWSLAFDGSEPVRSATLERFAHEFAPHGFRSESFYPCYGLAESTLFVTGSERGEEPVRLRVSAPALERDRVETVEGDDASRVLVSSGRPRMDQEISIVEPLTRRRLGSHRVGEIWLRSASSAVGYWNRPQLTEELFGARLEDPSQDGVASEGWLRTGDLGFLDDGELYVTGRHKDLIVIRGRNLYPQDVERVAEAAHRSLRPGSGAAFAVELDGAESLVVLQEVRRRAEAKVDLPAVAAAVRRAVVEEHQIQPREVVLLRAGETPKTSSGKIRRRAAAAAYREGSLQAVARDGAAPEATAGEGTREASAAQPTPTAPIVPTGDRVATERLVSLVGRILDLEPSRVPVDRPLVELGLDSLAAAELEGAVERELGRSAPEEHLEDLLAGATLDDLCRAIAGWPRTRPAPEEIAGPPVGDHPATGGQRALWFVHRLAPGSAAYNLAAAFRMAGVDGDASEPVDAARLERAVARLVERHPALRTALVTDGDGELLQRIMAPAELPGPRLQVVEGGDDPELLARLAEAPFDLARPPLARFVLVRQPDDREDVLLAVAHHAVADFASLAVAIDELGRFYADPDRELPPLSSSLAELARREAERLARPRKGELVAWWRDRLAGAPRVLELATDRPRPPVQRFRGDRLTRTVGEPGLAQRLEALGRRQGATLASTLLAGVGAWLARQSGQDDLLVGSSASLRGAAGLERVVGYLVNPLVLRLDLGADPTVGEAVTEAHGTVAAALGHRELPFGDLVEALQPERDPSRSPLFQVFFTLLRTPAGLGERLPQLLLGRSSEEAEPLELGGLRLAAHPLERTSAAFDLSLFAAATASGDLLISAELDRELFDRETVERMLDRLGVLLEGMVADPARSVSALPLLGAAERQEIVAASVGPSVDSWAAGDGVTLHGLVRAQMERTGEAVALTAGETGVTYRELGERVDRIRGRLGERGAAPGALVAVALHRGSELVATLLAVLETGAAYLPLDPTYPPERLAYMLTDSGAALLVADPVTAGTLAAAWDAASRDDDGEMPPVLSPDAGDGSPPSPAGPHRGDADSLCYLLYTSGSTGRPKAVEVPHRAVVSFLASMARRPGCGADDRLLAVTTVSFDISVLELFLPLVTGGRVVLAGRDEVVDPHRLARRLEQSGATLMQATPATWQMLVESGWAGRPGLTVLSGGEALPPALARALADKVAPDGAVWNLYGPTETTVWSSVARVEPDGPVTLGSPVAGTAVHLLDRHLRLVGVGVAGEVWIGGVGVTRGYRGRPALTAERFVPDPHGALLDEPLRTGARLYRVGDLARRRPDGTLEFLGRVDHQVKLRGHRIELGEIEAALHDHPRVGSAVVVLVERPGADRRLVALVTADDSAGIDGVPDLQALRDHLTRRLPDYMVPSAVLAVAELPRTSNRKVDRRAAGRLAAERLAGDGRERGRLEPPGGETERRVAEIWRQLLGVERIGRHDNFFDLGGHSLLATRLHRRLVDELDASLEVVDLFRLTTVAAQAASLSGAPAVSATPARRTAARGANGRDRIGADGFAVVGLACRFPGAAGPEALWEMLAEGREGITVFSREELLAAGVPEAELDRPDYVPASGHLDDADRFDAAAFDLSPREAEVMDPQHRLFLEAAWTALEDAGALGDRAGRSEAPRVGVFGSAGLNTYLLEADRSALTAAGSYQAFLGNDKDFVPTRVSYQLGLTGPSVNVQTACSSSLVALHLACRSLADGECDLALVGGVSVRVPLVTGYRHQPGGIFSPDGHCRAFDAEGRGTVFGSGVGMVVIKSLERALADGDTVRAVVRGSAINNDGADKIGFTAPSIEGQAEVIAEALAAADVDPHTVGYVEAHGTGTELGDPIEIAALGEALDVARRPAEAPSLLVGSVKSNIGHLDTAAGVAGLIKAILALGHHQVPPSVHFRRPNPRLDLRGGRIAVADRLIDWPANADRTPRRAGVSSFGIGGTNVHVVLEEAPVPVSAEAGATSRDHHLLTLSARAAGVLRTMAADFAGHLEKRLESAGDDPGRLADEAHTLAVGRRSFEHRLALSVKGAAEAGRLLREWLEGDGSPVAGLHASPEAGAATEPPRVVFLLPGQGTQHGDMAVGLYRSQPVFAASLDRAAEALVPRLGADAGEVRRILLGQVDEDRLRRTELAQPALFALELALAHLWMDLGVRPAALVGHSVGELVAACLAGVFPLELALDLVAERGRLMGELPTGSMLALDLPEAETAELLATSGAADGGVGIAALNGPRDTVVSGPTPTIEELEHWLEGAGGTIRVRRLHTSHAFHSSMMEPAAAALAAWLAERTEGAPLGAPRVPLLSNVTGDWITDAEATDPAYWGRQLRHPVRFAPMVERVWSDPAPLALEVGPGRALGTLVRRALGAAAKDRVLQSLPHPRDPATDQVTFLDAVARLWVGGVEIDRSGLYRGEERRRLPLPAYPFRPQRHWIPSAPPPETIAELTVAGREDDPERWLWAPVWEQEIDGGAPTATDGRWLILAPEAPWRHRLAAALAAVGASEVAVGRGMEALPDDGSEPLRIVLAAELFEDEGPFGLVELAAALDGRNLAPGSELVLLTHGLHRPGAAGGRRAGQALPEGLLRVVPQEVPGLACRSVDWMAPADDDPSGELDLAVGDLVAELVRRPAGGEGPVSPVALRDGERWRRRFDRLPLAPAAEPGAGPAPGGVVLVTGGLGGVGLELARDLARRDGSRLALLGRRTWPSRDAWDDLSAGSPEAEVARRVRELESLGAEVLLVSADVTDGAALDRALEAIDQRFGGLDGVIHAAGTAGGGFLAQADRERMARVLAAKVEGTETLAAALDRRALDRGRPPAGFLLLCSSITGVVGGLGQGDYAAANAFQDAWAEAVGRRGLPGVRRVLSVAWDRWRGVGMAAAGNSGFEGLLAELGEEVHPLLGRRLPGSADRTLFRAVLAPETHWVLGEHTIADRPTVPGATFLEMARAAFAQAHGRSEGEPAPPVALADVVFLTPLAVDPGTGREVVTALEGKATDGGPVPFRILSRAAGAVDVDRPWVEHARGRVGEASDGDVASLPPDGWDRLSPWTRSGPADAVVGTGPRWESLREVLHGETEGGALRLAHLELPEAFADDLAAYGLHPALLDVATGFVRLVADGEFLPLAYERLVQRSPLPARFASRVRLRQTEAGAETLVADLSLVDPDGRELVGIRGFAMKRVDEGAVERLARAAEPGGEPSPAATTAEGLSAAEGVEVFRRLLARLEDGAVRTPPRVVVSPRPVDVVGSEVQGFDRLRLAEALRNLAPPPPAGRSGAGTRTGATELPPGGLETVIAEVWKQVLGVETVSLHDNYFELGGSSLTAVQVVSELQARLGREVPAVSLFEAPTVAALARRLAPDGESAEPAFAGVRRRARQKEAAAGRRQVAAARRRRRNR